jgi:hypothetical protein
MQVLASDVEAVSDLRKSIIDLVARLRKLPFDEDGGIGE